MMRSAPRKTTAVIAALFAVALCAGPALAEKGGRGNDGPGVEAGPGHGHGRGQGQGHAGGHQPGGASVTFGDRDRVVVRSYFGESFGGRGCPPGLAKKGNGCMPPGQARKWAIGQPLPAGVAVYELPPELVVQLTPPPSGYRYVRMAGDILMIAAGTSMVVDAIQDLGR